MANGIAATTEVAMVSRKTGKVAMGVTYVAFSPDGKRLATASWDGTARVWDAQTGKELAMMGNGNRVQSVAFSPDGKKVATASDDKTARVWDIETDKELAKMVHDDLVRSVAFSPDGKMLATAGVDKIARVWLISGEDLICEACSRMTCNLTTEEWRKQYRGTCTADYKTSCTPE